MIIVKEAEEIINENSFRTESINVDLQNAYGEVLREDIFADREQPPFHRVAMDGISINIEAWSKGKRKFLVQDIQRAGSDFLKLTSNDNCIEVMTGAVLPLKTTCVIRVEDITFHEENNKRFAEIKEGLSLTLMENVHQKGIDYEKGSLLLNQGGYIFSPEIGILASVGKSEVLVSKKPSIAIISTGDELVGITETPKEYQIRMSNSYSIYSVLKKLNYPEVKIFHLKDDKESLLKEIKEILEKFDILILSGGVSMGKFDYIPAVLKELEIAKIFHKIAQKPGKPMWFGRSKYKIVFALPGNPVSTLVCFYKYVIPYLNKCIGIEPKKTCVTLTEEVKVKNTNLTNFFPVKMTGGNIKVVKNNGSGDYASLAKSDGFIELEEGKDVFLKKSVVPFYSWKV